MVSAHEHLNEEKQKIASLINDIDIQIIWDNF